MNALGIEPGTTWFMLPARLKSLEAIKPVPSLRAHAGGVGAFDDQDGDEAPTPEDAMNVSNGVAVLSVRGPMMRSPSVFARKYGGFVGYEEIIAAADDLRNDPNVSAVVLSMDTPGGSVNGIEDATNALAQLAASKPLVSHTSGLMCSGGVYLASAANERYATRDATVGSIGVICSVLDLSRMLANEGIGIVHIAEPAGKAALRIGQPVTAEATADLRESVVEDYQIFRERVSTATGLTNEQIDAMDARVYTGTGAKRAGLVNGVGSIQQAIDRAAALAKTKRTATMPVTTKTAAPTATVTTNNPDGSVKTAEVEVKPTEPKVEPAAPAAATLAQIEAAVPADLPGRSDLILGCMRDQATLADVGAKVVQSYAGLVKQRDASIATLQGEVATLKETIAKAQKAGTIAFNPNPLPEAKSDGPADKGAGAKAFITNVQAEMKAGKTQPDAILSVHASNPDLYKAWSDAGAPPIQHAA